MKSSTRLRSSGCSAVAAESSPTRMMVVQEAGSCSSEVAMTMPATRERSFPPALPGAERPMPSRARAGASLPSVSTSESSTTSSAGVGSSWTVSLRTRSMDTLVSRWEDIHRWPVLLPAWRVCGSQDAHSQSSDRPGSQKTPTVRSAGPTWTAAWASRDRASARVSSRGPTMPTTPALVRSTSTGAESNRALARAVLHFLIQPWSCVPVQRGFPRYVARAGVEGEEVLGICAALPQGRGRKGGPAHHRRGVGDHPVTALGFGCGSGANLLLKLFDRTGEPLILFLESAGEAAFLFEPHSNGHDRAQHGEHREAQVTQDHHHRDGHDQRGQYRDVAELTGRRHILAATEGPADLLPGACPGGADG